MIKQQLTLHQQQKLSPLQIQQIKLLELTALEIENRINQELEENPALEEISDSDKDDFDIDESLDEGDVDENDDTPEDLRLGDYLTEDDIPDYEFRQFDYSKAGSKDEIPYSEAESFQEYLLNQLAFKNIPEEGEEIAKYLIGSLDEDGYLRRSSIAISDDLLSYGRDIDPKEIEKNIRVIQELDPPGVGATDLQTCLLLQLKRKEKTRLREKTIILLSDYFDAFSKKQYDKVIKGMNISEDELKDIIKEITALNPRPCSGWESTMETKMTQVTPDFYVDIINGELVFSMKERNIPELRISREYNTMLDHYSRENDTQSQGKKDALLFIKQKVESAKWFIDAIKQRNITLRNTMLAIIELQKKFFLTGEEANLRPMILKDVAEICNYDISTISRVSNSKYVQTIWGVYPLKYFFSESLTNEEGEEVSTREIKAILKQCIEEEAKNRPLTDDALVVELKKKGYAIARRTVAKYREQLNIPVARLRKTI